MNQQLEKTEGNEGAASAALFNDRPTSVGDVFILHINSCGKNDAVDCTEFHVFTEVTDERLAFHRLEVDRSYWIDADWYKSIEGRDDVGWDEVVWGGPKQRVRHEFVTTTRTEYEDMLDGWMHWRWRARP